MKHKAPAVHQAIEILELLIKSGPLSLGRIAETTGFSKATIMRLLETMEAHDWVKRDKADKSYDSLIVVRKRDNFSPDLEELIQKELDKLCERTKCTVEWYLLRDDYVEILQRSEPENKLVNIKAQLGFRRAYASELDAVIRIAMAAGDVDCAKMEPPEGYISYKPGEYTRISLNDAIEQIKKVDESLFTYDHEWNNNGIRRHAIGIKNAKEKLSGILALATSFTPKADLRITSLNQELKDAKTRIEKLFS